MDDPHGTSPQRDAARFLGLIVEQEARRTLTEAQLAPDPARLADGWTRRFVTDAARLGEVVELYRTLGFEVCADPIRSEDLADDCEECKLVALRGFRMVYTRNRPGRR